MQQKTLITLTLVYRHYFKNNKTREGWERDKQKENLANIWFLQFIVVSFFCLTPKKNTWIIQNKSIDSTAKRNRNDKSNKVMWASAVWMISPWLNWHCWHLVIKMNVWSQFDIYSYIYIQFLLPIRSNTIKIHIQNLFLIRLKYILLNCTFSFFFSNIYKKNF